MKRCLSAVMSVLLLTTASAFAGQGGPKPKSPKPPKPPVSAAAPKPHVAKVKPVTVKTTQGAKPPKPVKAITVKPAKSTTKAAKPVATKATKSTKTTTVTKSAKADANTPPSGEPVTLTKVQQKLQQNTKLAAKLQDRLPRGTDLMVASEGFKNLGQFVAAVNVSNDLGLSFDSLKTSMVDDGYSLGQSIQRVKAEANGPVEAQRAETAAQRMIAESEGQVGSTTTATTTTTTTAKAKAKKTVGGQP